MGGSQWTECPDQPGKGKGADNGKGMGIYGDEGKGKGKGKGKDKDKGMGIYGDEGKGKDNGKDQGKGMGKDIGKDKGKAKSPKQLTLERQQELRLGREREWKGEFQLGAYECSNAIYKM